MSINLREGVGRGGRRGKESKRMGWGMLWGLSGATEKIGQRSKSVSRSVSLTTSFLQILIHKKKTKAIERRWRKKNVPYPDVINTTISKLTSIRVKIATVALQNPFQNQLPTFLPVFSWEILKQIQSWVNVFENRKWNTCQITYVRCSF